MTQRIIYTTPENDVRVVIPANICNFEALAEETVPHGCPWIIADETTLPTGRFFRDCWEADLLNSNVFVSLPKARVFFMDLLRRERDAKLLTLDTEMIIAIGKNDQTAMADIEARKTALRNLPTNVQPAVNMADTLAELCICWPTLLADVKPDFSV